MAKKNKQPAHSAATTATEIRPAQIYAERLAKQVDQELGGRRAPAQRKKKPRAPA